jgi:hypothetical protein
MNLSKSTTYAIVISIVVIGAAISAYQRSHHSTVHTNSTANLTNSQASTTQYSGVTAPELPSASCHANQALPDATCTAGVINPNVTQDNIQQTICVSGYTKTIRPSASYTNKIKAEQMSEYGYTDSIHAHEEDHLISLELGGSPDDPKNLWPEPHASPNPKDKVENYLHAAVCSGRISLHDAQVRIATDWTTADAGL